jgi:D-arabinose 5-phosphate isomerase GutQ
MKPSATVKVGTGVSGLVVFTAAIALGWFGFPALIVHEIKHVSTNLDQQGLGRV